MKTTNLMKEAHKMTREIKKEFPEVDYKAQLGICISFLYEKNKKGNDKMEMAKLEGSEKQVAWANDIRSKMVEGFKMVDYLNEEFKKSENEITKKALYYINAATKRIKTETSAKWFIDNRNNVKDVMGINVEVGSYNIVVLNLMGMVWDLHLLEKNEDEETEDKIERRIGKFVSKAEKHLVANN